MKVPQGIAKTWRFDLGGSVEEGTFWGINNLAFDPDRVDHKVRLGDTEAWRLRNDSALTHYVHIHAEQWRTVSRNGGPPLPWERAASRTSGSSTPAKTSSWPPGSRTAPGRSWCTATCSTTRTTA